jgi:16S rRNA (cytidine1402-2'-O)-methyltransferase
MLRKQAFQNQSPTVYLIATPIGNFEDITFRAINTLKKIDVIYAEDTRVTLNLLKHYDIEKPLKSFHEHNKQLALPQVMSDLENGKSVGLVSDAGMPLISDPGYELVLMAHEKGFNVVSIPGANAALAALSVAGIAPQPFLFYGFLPMKATKRASELARLKAVPETLVFYEAPHRVNETLLALYSAFGDRDAAIVREITKLFEEIIKGTLGELQTIGDLKGEIVIVVSGLQPEAPEEITDIKAEIDRLIATGMTKNDAIKQVANGKNVHKSIVYKEYHEVE